MKNTNIFLVEDDASMVRLLVKILKFFGHQVVLITNNVQDALENLDLLETLNVRLAILDGRFLDKPSGQEVDDAGKQVAEAIRAMYSNIKIIAYAGQPEDYGDIFLQKPASLEAISEAIEQMP